MCVFVRMCTLHVHVYVCVSLITWVTQSTSAPMCSVIDQYIMWHIVSRYKDNPIACFLLLSALSTVVMINAFVYPMQLHGNSLVLAGVLIVLC